MICPPPKNRIHKFSRNKDLQQSMDPSIAGGSTVRTFLVAKLQAASVPIAQAAVPWDRKTNRQTQNAL